MQSDKVEYQTNSTPLSTSKLVNLFARLLPFLKMSYFKIHSIINLHALTPSKSACTYSIYL